MTIGPEARPDPNQLAGELRLGVFQRRHGMVLPLLLGPLFAGVLLFALPWLLLWISLHEVNALPWWVAIPIGAVSLWLSVVLIWRGWHRLRDRGRRLLRYERGLIELARGSMQAIRWDAVIEVWHSPERTFVGGGTVAVSGPFLTLVDAAGQRLQVGPEVAGQAELIQVVRETVMPQIRGRVEGILEGGGQVRFGTLILSTHGLETEDGRRTLTWRDVANVRRSADGVRVRAVGRLLPWFEGDVPNPEVLVEMAGERIGRRSGD
jgi:hypothetical protein